MIEESTSEEPTIKGPLFVPLPRLSKILGLPHAWLQREVDAGRIPHLYAGGRKFFSAEAVRRTLVLRMSGTGGPAARDSDES